MKIINFINKKHEKTISAEIEPPLIGKSINNIWKILNPLVELGINYINITNHPKNIIKEGDLVYQIKRPSIMRITKAIIKKYDVEPVPHIICAGFTKYGIEKILTDFDCIGVKNVMALRGDPPKLNGNFIEFKPEKEGYSYAKDLIKQIADLREGIYIRTKGGTKINFCIGASCYPEGYYESQPSDESIKWAKAKIDAGADYLVTQLFLDNTVYLNFVEKAKIDIPIIPGIFPISLYKHLEKLPKVFGCSIPKKLEKEVEKYKGNEEDIRKVGIDWCVKQCLGLLENGVPSLHFFANRGAPVEEVIKGVYYD